MRAHLPSPDRLAYWKLLLEVVALTVLVGSVLLVLLRSHSPTAVVRDLAGAP